MSAILTVENQTMSSSLSNTQKAQKAKSDKHGSSNMRLYICKKIN